jgi:putative (di)nucleoside polyphosphate hydrolase
LLRPNGGARERPTACHWPSQSAKPRWRNARFLLHKLNMPAYRLNAAIILQNSNGEILVCERSDWWGCWQFPQGGVKKGETLLDALYREVEEELGLKPTDYRILASKGPYRYLFMNGRKKDGFDGQEQHYFLAELTNPKSAIRFEGSHEFRAARWLPPASYDLDWIGPMKREVYASVFRDFFGIEPQRLQSRKFC